MQRQLQKAETMLSTCMQTVEAAWEMSAQKLAKFDEKLSELDGRLLLLNDKQQLDAASLSVNALPATPSMEPLTVASKTAPVPSDLFHHSSRLSSLENRVVELQQRLDATPSSHVQDERKQMESLDFLNHRIASLSERLSAEAKVREAQFRRLEALLLKPAPAAPVSASPLRAHSVDHTQSMPSLPSRNLFLEAMEPKVEPTAAVLPTLPHSVSPSPTRRPFTPHVTPPGARRDLVPVVHVPRDAPRTPRCSPAPPYRRPSPMRMDAAGYTLLPHHVKAQREPIKEYLVANPVPVQHFTLETKR